MSESPETGTVKPAEGFEYYGNTIYWNNYDRVCQIHNTLITGREDLDWFRYLKQSYGTFDHAFFVNCGNGWVERDLFRIGAIRRASGSDISPELLEQAAKEAAAIGLPASYALADVNAFDAQGATYDLAVNVGAMHHVAYIDRMTRVLAQMLGRDGIYATFDYVGAHRNQYSWEMWSKIVEMNNTLPPRFRIELRYPSLHVMLHTDPSEAVHSELQEECLRRYFDLDQYTPLGGSIAYTLLYQNHALHAAQHEPEGAAVIERIMAADAAHLERHPRDNLFSYWTARPKREMPNRAVLGRWENEERAREEAAQRDAGRYYPAGALEILYGEMEALRARAAS